MPLLISRLKPPQYSGNFINYNGPRIIESTAPEPTTTMSSWNFQAVPVVPHSNLFIPIISTDDVLKNLLTLLIWRVPNRSLFVRLLLRQVEINEAVPLSITIWPVKLRAQEIKKKARHMYDEGDSDSEEEDSMSVVSTEKQWTGRWKILSHRKVNGNGWIFFVKFHGLAYAHAMWISPGWNCKWKWRSFTYKSIPFQAAFLLSFWR